LCSYIILILFGDLAILKTKLKAFTAFILVLSVYTCIDPYTPKLSGYDSLLVVEGMISDLNASYSIRLSRTFTDYNSTPSRVTDATVYITDDSGNSSSLTYFGNGTYKTDSTVFIGEVGKTYILHITAADGTVYESEPYFMESVPEIDSIYFAKDQQYINNGTALQDGLSIYLDSKEGDDNQYFRWDYEETWKFRIPYPKLYIYANCEVIYQVPEVKDVYCWKTGRSNTLITDLVHPGQSHRIVKEPVSFIATELSDRLTIEYSILVKQYSISKKEYEFWENIKKINKAGSDIFALQPYSVISNIHNKTNPNERVLGYFQVSSVKQKRKFISFNDISEMRLPNYLSPCPRYEVACVNPFIDDYCEEFNAIWRTYAISNKLIFIEPIMVGGLLEKLVFTTSECADCQVTGTLNKPDFWIDL
jgi:hypothetical protein